MSKEEINHIIEELNALYKKASDLRRKSGKALGGIQFNRKFGIYEMNIPSNEAFFNYIEANFVENEKLFQCVLETLEKKNDNN